MWLFIIVQTMQCKVALHRYPDNAKQRGSSSLYRQCNAMWFFTAVQTMLYRQHTAMWLFIAVQTTQCNVALHCCTDNTMQCGSSFAVQTTQCNVALNCYTNNTMQCGSSLLYRQRNAMWLFIAVQTMQCNVALHRCTCLLYTSPSPRDRHRSRMPSSA